MAYFLRFEFSAVPDTQCDRNFDLNKKFAQFADTSGLKITTNYTRFLFKSKLNKPSLTQLI